MIPFEASRISSKLSSPFRDSILEKTNLDVAAREAEDLADLAHVVRLAHEGGRDEVYALLHAED
jgi:hypothetical protein